MRKGQILGPRKVAVESKSLITQARVAAGLTQQQMADKMQVMRGTYAAWEIRPVDSVSTLKRIAAALDVDWKMLVE